MRTLPDSRSEPFFLGAGASTSVDCNFPLASELTLENLRNPTNYPDVHPSAERVLDAVYNLGGHQSGHSPEKRLSEGRSDSEANSAEQNS